MGARIIALATPDTHFEVVAAVERPGHEAMGRDAGQAAGVGPLGLLISDTIETAFDVLIDFSLPEGTMDWLNHCLTARQAIVIGTTGHTPEQNQRIDEAARTIPVLKATNMSLGVNLLFKLAGQVAGALGEDYDIEIVETHHRFKVDAPSGTAMTLRDEVLDATGRDADQDVIYGRQGNVGQRPSRQVGMHALRVGDTVGEHELHFGNIGETITLKHTAHTRDTFVKGALRAAAWLHHQSPGRYDMHDVLGMK